MSVSLKEVISAGGYDLKTYDDAIWLLSVQREFDELVDNAQDLVDKMNDERDFIADQEQEKRDLAAEVEYEMHFPRECEE